jgi:hypothetical protein
MAEENLIVDDYEVFNNDHDSLAFFLFHQAVLDQNPPEGPFAFSIQGDSILAGTQAHHIIFPNINADVVEVARQRGVIMIMEFEGQQPVRCTPCYFSEEF